MNTQIYFLLAATLALTACATAPKPLRGTFRQISPRDAHSDALNSATVRWGGSIIQTHPKRDETCFEMLSVPLYSSARPKDSANDADTGRFIACHSGFYDPAIFKPGREVTFTGKITGFETTQIGDFSYQLPKLSADVIYLWPVIQRVELIPAVPLYGPGPGPGFFAPSWGWRIGGWWTH